MLSVILLTDNSERALVPTLAALVKGAMSGLVREVVVSDGASTDATVAVADYAGCIVLSEPAPTALGPRLAAAAAAARAPWLMFLRAGMVPDATWLDEVALFIEQADHAGGVRRGVSINPPSGNTGRSESAAVFGKASPRRAPDRPLRGALAVIGFGMFARAHPDQGLLIPAQLYRDIGGHRDVDNTEADLLARLGRRRIMMLQSKVRVP